MLKATSSDNDACGMNEMRGALGSYCPITHGTLQLVLCGGQAFWTASQRSCSIWGKIFQESGGFSLIKTALGGPLLRRLLLALRATCQEVARLVAHFSIWPFISRRIVLYTMAFKCRYALGVCQNTRCLCLSFKNEVTFPLFPHKIDYSLQCN